MMGNVRVTFSDDNGNGLLAGDEIRSRNDYYTFGMEMNSRWKLLETYHLLNQKKYNGKEWVNDMNLGQLLYGKRPYNPILCRFESTDPISHMFPSLSGYNYASNNPIRNIDLHGLQGVDAVEKWVETFRQNIVDASNKIVEYFDFQNLVSGTESQKVETLSKLHSTAKTSTRITNKALDVIDSGAECVGNTCDVVQNLALATTALSGGTTAPVTGPIAGGAEVMSNIALGVQVGTDYARDGKIDKTTSQVVVKIVTRQAGKFNDKKISELDNLGKTGDKTKAAVRAVNSGVINTTEKVANKKIDQNNSNFGTWWGGGEKY